MSFVRRAAALVAAGLILVAGGAMSSSVAAAGESGAASDAGSTVVVRAAASDDLITQARERVATMTLRERAEAVVMGHVPTTDAAVLRSYMQQTGIGGFILMGENIPAAEDQLRTETAALTLDDSLPPLIATDQEGGDVARVRWDAFPGALTLKNSESAATRDAFAGRAALLQRVGIGVNFGVVADMTADPGAFIYRRALGTTPDAASDRVDAAVNAEQPELLTTLKHFPGHGGAPGDSHDGIPATPLSKAQWESSDAVPFQAGIDAGAPLLMFGHLAYTAVDPTPASMSATWHRIARDELGFGGVAITDDLGMLEAAGIAVYADPVANAVNALVAGNDMVLTVMFSGPGTAPRIVDGIVAAVDSGTLTAARLDEAAVRVVELRLQTAAAGRGLVPCATCAPAE